MKFLVILFSDQNEFQSQKLFPSAAGQNKSASERSMEWAQALTVDGSQKEILVLEGKGWTSGQLLENIVQAAEKAAADFVVFAHSSFAFLDLPLTKKLIQDHIEFKAEYTFADGYPSGFAPEILDLGAASIMAELCKGPLAAQAQKPVTKESLFDIIKGDVNSFEIETEIASVDYRLLRMDFVCDSKTKALAAQALALKLVQDNKQSLLELDDKSVGEENVLKICQEAAADLKVLKTVPAFYNVQIEGKSLSKNSFSPYEPSDGRMPYEKFEALVQKIKGFSDKAVVSLSLFGEAALHPDFDKFVLCLDKAGLESFVEIDGGHLPDFLQSQAYKNIARALNGERRKKVIFVVCLDAATQKTFEAFHSGDLQKAADAFKALAADFPESYPQFTRVNENEGELEAFYRFWSDKASPSGGKIIVQKYDHFCGRLPDKKPADLAPLVREPCWHLRRDMDILLCGSVPLCRDRYDQEVLGNALEQDLAEIWSKKDSLLSEHMNKEYKGPCGNCDEWYTFNF